MEVFILTYNRNVSGNCVNLIKGVYSNLGNAKKAFEEEVADCIRELTFDTDSRTEEEVYEMFKIYKTDLVFSAEGFFTDDEYNIGIETFDVE